ncbi:ABC transporter permease [Amphibacillus sediminis]|uniref:ABC transporter permease n=1 Tax=Amphibacillus sediminis TaxID=360185 RepID=UPI0009FA0F11|nr:ABC transporter permease [Amphibacillus sediminis]
MKRKILVKDLRRNKVIITTLFVFILLATLLVSGATQIMVTLFSSMDNLFIAAKAPHYVQMYAGDLNQAEIDTFTEENPLVRNQQTVTMLGINGAYLYLGDNENSEANSIIENSFVKQNQEFDFLLDTNNHKIDVNDGEIGVPIYHMKEYGLELGDKVQIVKNNLNMEFTITAFVRDAQMNPAIVTSKRFVVNDNDWMTLQNHCSEEEYLIEFLLHDVNDVNEFEALYQSSSLPQQGTAINYTFYRVLNALTDGVVVAVIMLISVLLLAIALLCIRLTLIATIEEDYREIGVMKAIGISKREIKRLYLAKYIIISFTASVCGYLISLFIGHVFTANISLYLGSSNLTIWSNIIPFLGALFVFGIILLFCQVVLRKISKISPIDALRQMMINGNKYRSRGFKLSRCFVGNPNIFLGLKAVFSQFSLYGTLSVIFLVCVGLMNMPFNLLNTLTSPEFITYMGAGRSDIRIDIQHRQDMDSVYRQINQYLIEDQDIVNHTGLVTAAYRLENADGLHETIKIESGDFSIFPLEYLNGTAPDSVDQMAISSLYAEELDKKVGDEVTLLTNDDRSYTLSISGIYQDITNGGRTAKAQLPYQKEDILWYVINIELASGISVADKTMEYNREFPEVKVTEMDEYLSQTLGGLVDQLALIVKLAFGLAIIIAVLITAMFCKMLLAKESKQIGIMHHLGIPYRNIQVQYLTRILTVLLLGTVLGVLSAMTLGQELAVALITGISKMEFIIDPFVSWFVYPVSLILTVSITIIWCSQSIPKRNLMPLREE